MDEFMSVSQEGTVIDYCNEFRSLFDQIKKFEELSEFYAIYVFMVGLEPRIKDIFMTWHQYSCETVEDVISLALKIDANELQDSFSPFDPNSCFYTKDLVFDIKITLDELMKDNEFFRNGRIQETSNEDRVFGKFAYKVFDELPERVGVSTEVPVSEKPETVNNISEVHESLLEIQERIDQQSSDNKDSKEKEYDRGALNQDLSTQESLDDEFLNQHMKTEMGVADRYKFGEHIGIWLHTGWICNKDMSIDPSCVFLDATGTKFVKIQARVYMWYKQKSKRRWIEIPKLSQLKWSDTGWGCFLNCRGGGIMDIKVNKCPKSEGEVVLASVVLVVYPSDKKIAVLWDLESLSPYVIREYGWSMCNRHLRPQIFCLEHASKNEEYLDFMDGGKLLIICYSGFHEIQTQAYAIAKQSGRVFRYNDVHVDDATCDDLNLLNVAIGKGSLRIGLQDMVLIYLLLLNQRANKELMGQLFSFKPLTILLMVVGSLVIRTFEWKLGRQCCSSEKLREFQHKCIKYVVENFVAAKIVNVSKAPPMGKNLRIIGTAPYDDFSNFHCRRKTSTDAEELSLNKGELVVKKLHCGANKLADLLGVTFGFKGRYVVLKSKYGPPKVLNDGLIIAKENDLDDLAVKTSQRWVVALMLVSEEVIDSELADAVCVGDNYESASAPERFNDQVASVKPHHDLLTKMIYMQMEYDILVFSKGSGYIGIKPSEMLAFFANQPVDVALLNDSHYVSGFWKISATMLQLERVSVIILWVINTKDNSIHWCEEVLWHTLNIFLVGAIATTMNMLNKNGMAAMNPCAFSNFTRIREGSTTLLSFTHEKKDIMTNFSKLTYGAT